LPASVSGADIIAVTAFLKDRGLKRLRCRRRANALILEAGPKDDALSLVRLRKLSPTAWAADEFHHSGRWAPLPIRGPLAESLQTIADDFSWLFEA
jgi:hypothetical protein